MFFDMPLNSSPPTLDARELRAEACRRASQIRSRTLPCGADSRRGTLIGLDELAECGVIGFKAFMSNSGIDDFLACDDQSLLEGMAIAAKLNLACRGACRKRGHHQRTHRAGH